MAPPNGAEGQFALLERLIRIETILNEGRHSDLDHEARIRALESERHPDHETRLTDLNARLRTVERAVWVAAGVAAALGGAVGGIVGPMIGGG